MRMRECYPIVFGVVIMLISLSLLIAAIIMNNPEMPSIIEEVCLNGEKHMLIRKEDVDNTIVLVSLDEGC